MKFGMFYEHQLPRPWGPDGEHTLLKDALEQVELADRLGLDCVWEVEHHFLEEYSHSSAPEVFLAAASQRTNRIRLGHGIVQIPFNFNHPARVVERVNTLDLVSDGRVEFGTGESSSEAELGGFLIPREEKRDQWLEAFDAITRMFVEEPFAGYKGKWFDMPVRNVIPKSLQEPHPPMWVACSRRETIQLAAQKGIGALSFSFIEPEEAKQWADGYYATIQSDECVAGGFAVNPNLACVMPMMVHPDEEEAIERGRDGGHCFGDSLLRHYAFGQHQPGVTNIWEEVQEQRPRFGFDRSTAGQTGTAPPAQRVPHGRAPRCIGAAVATRLASEGMRVVLADVEEGPLADAEKQLADTGASVLAVPTDVTKGDQVEALAAKTFETFGTAHVVHNNAGVATG